MLVYVCVSIIQFAYLSIVFKQHEMFDDSDCWNAYMYMYS